MGRYVNPSANTYGGPTLAGTIVEAAPRTRARILVIIPLRLAGHASVPSGDLWSKWGTHSSTAWASSTQAALPLCAIQPGCQTASVGCCSRREQLHARVQALPSGVCALPRWCQQCPAVQHACVIWAPPEPSLARNRRRFRSLARFQCSTSSPWHPPSCPFPLPSPLPPPSPLLLSRLVLGP